MNINEYIGDIMNELGDVTVDCTALIGQEQIAQIKALKVEIESLKSQLQEKSEHIAFLQKSKISHIDEYEDAINDIIQEQVNNISNKNNLDLLKELHSIDNTTDARQKIQKLFRFAQKTNEYQTKYSIPRLCSVIQGHVEFLTRLAESPELQSLFLVSSHSGKTFLPETTRQLLLEQASRTSEFLGDVKKQPRKNEEFGDISSILNLDVDVSKRIQSLAELLKSDDFEILEIRSLLLQETTISSALRRYAENLLMFNENEKKVNAEYKRAFNHLSKMVNNNMNNKEGNVGSIIKIAKEIENQFSAMKKELDQKDSLLQNHSKSAKTTKMTIQNQDMEIQNKENKIHQQENEINEINEMLSKVRLENEKLMKIHRKDKIKIQQTSLSAAQNAANNSSRQSNDWTRWGQRLYYALTGISGEDIGGDDVRMAIEEAALTAVGNPKVQSFIKQISKGKSWKF